MTSKHNILIRKPKIIFLLFGTILIIGIFFYFLSLFSPPKQSAKLEEFIIPLGSSENKIINTLYLQGYIKSPTVFKVILLHKTGRKGIEPGGYEIAKNMSPFKIADILINRPCQKWIIVPEGLRKEEIAEIIQKKLNWTEIRKNNFLASAKEGYLFPDTYLFNIDSPGKEISKIMSDNFYKKTADIFNKVSKNNTSLNTIVTLASLVQREAANKKEMPLIAGIIQNRLLFHMNLDIDAGIQYILGTPNKWWPIVKKEDYKINSPYNTYLHKGEPPAPICNPGIEAIKSIIHPRKSDYLYYIHDQNHQIHLAKTYKKHLENIKKYILFPAVEQFTKEYLLIYRSAENSNNYNEIKKFLVEKEANRIEKLMSSKKNYVLFDDYKITEITETRDNPKIYIVKAKLYHKEKAIRNGVPIKIYIIRKNGSFKVLKLDFIHSTNP